MKIVVLDGFTLNPGDLDWEPLHVLGPTEIYDRTPGHQILERSGGAAILLTNKTPLTAVAIEALPDLRYIGVLATGINVVDTDAARRRGIPVTNVPAYGTESVAQLTFAHLLNLVSRVGSHAEGVVGGRWSAAKDWCYWDHPLTALHDLTIGIVGYGRIGRTTGRIARAFGMRVIAAENRERIDDEGVEQVGIDELFRRSDVVTLHCPLTEETRALVSRMRLESMKPSSLLINTSRGGLVDEPALADALNSGRIAGAGLDVLSVEPPPISHPLLHARNCFITPHLAWATRSARERLLAEAIENVRAFLAGTPRNVVNGGG